MTLTAAVARGLDRSRCRISGAAPLPARLDVQLRAIRTAPGTCRRTSHVPGIETVANATVQSDSTVYARLALDVGPANIVAMAQKLGVRSSLELPRDAVPSITLGTIGVTPLEEASAYATLAAGGVYSKPMAITRVVLPNGKVDTTAPWGKPQRERVIPDWVAATVTRVLEQNMLYGTGRGAHIYNHTPGRRAPTATPTRGSGLRRGSRRQCGSAFRAVRSRC